MPIKWRSLEETLNPQPVAFNVIRKLLQYIDRCDEASKTNLPRPRFCTEDGSPIFPPEGDEFELWWLTDVKRKEKGDDEQKGDEDGPPESEATDEGEEDKEKNAAELTSDSDPDSEPGDHEPSSQQGVILPVRHDGSQSMRTPSRPGWAPGTSASSHSIG